MAQVAEYAGVSQASVSRVLNGVATVDPAIVRQGQSRAIADAELLAERSRPQPRARPQPHRSRSLVPDLENPMFQGVLKGLTSRPPATATACSWPTAPKRVADRGGDRRRGPQQVRRARPRLAAHARPSELEDLIQRTAPVVVVNRRVDERPGRAARRSTTSGGARSSACTSCGFGHSRDRVPRRPAAQLRQTDCAREGSRELVAASTSELEFVTSRPGPAWRTGYAPPRTCSRPARPPSIAFNDLVALGLLLALREIGVDVPEQLSVVGIDDIPHRAIRRPAAHDHVRARASRSARQAWSRMRRCDARATPATHPLSTGRCSRSPGEHGTRARRSGWLAPAVRCCGSATGWSRSTRRARASTRCSRPVRSSTTSSLARRARRVRSAEPTDHPHHLGIEPRAARRQRHVVLGRPHVRAGRGLDHGAQPRACSGATSCTIDGARARGAAQLDRRARGRAAHRGARAHRPSRARRRAGRLGAGVAQHARRELRRASPSAPRRPTGARARGTAACSGDSRDGRPRVFSRAGEGEAAVHGSTTPWLAVVDARART